MIDENIHIKSELGDILFHLEYAQKGIKYLEENGFAMKTIRQNLAFLIDGIVEWENYRKEENTND